MMTERENGTVKWFNATKGYGFIEPVQGGMKDVFVHISAIQQSGLRRLDEGQRVSYELSRAHNGKEAAININVEV